MLNAIEKLHALLISDHVNVWHFPSMKEPDRFVYWLPGESGESTHKFTTLEAMIDSAYAHIDPMLVPTPETCPVPPQVGLMAQAGVQPSGTAYKPYVEAKLSVTSQRIDG